HVPRRTLTHGHHLRSIRRFTSLIQGRGPARSSLPFVTAPTQSLRLGSADIVFLALLLVFVPATIVAARLHAGTWVFVLAALALIPLARWIGTATEAVAAHLGPGLGGLLNATFGNAAE